MVPDQGRLIDALPLRTCVEGSWQVQAWVPHTHLFKRLEGWKGELGCVDRGRIEWMHNVKPTV